MTRAPAIDAFRLVATAAEAERKLAANRLEARARLRFGVAQALAQGRVSFAFQPVVSAGRGRLPAFFELLARITLPNGQLLSAGSFLPAVEDGPLGRAIDRLALATAIDHLSRTPGIRLSVNVSPRSMGDEAWLATLAAAPRAACGRLILEITEDAAMADAAQTIEFMEHVRGTGAAFALDDFGAGATGFRHFREFRFDMVKIDGAFIRDVHRIRDGQVLVDCLVTVARHFEMLVIAERVETEADAAWLADHGVDCLQGYLCGRPAAMTELLAADAIIPADRQRLAG